MIASEVAHQYVGVEERLRHPGRLGEKTPSWPVSLFRYG